MPFEFATAGRIIYGPGTLRDVPAIASGWGTQACIVTGKNRARAALLIRLLEATGITCTAFQVPHEPTTEIVTAGTELARNSGAEMIIAIGGGSVIDAGKAISALLTNPGELLDYLEVIGRGKAIAVPPLPFMAIPTTAGTGAEVTRNAVISSTPHHVKVSMRSHLMLPRLAVIDPELTYSLPTHITASTGLDALTQLVEAFVARQANPFTDGLCREGMMRAARSLRPACFAGGPESRADMGLAALFSGLALANAGLGAVHGLAAPLGGLLAAPHGMICARLLPIVTKTNILALKSRVHDSPALDRYSDVARILTQNPDASPQDAPDWLDELCLSLEVPSLSQWGLKPSSFSMLVRQARSASSMKSNPIELTETELHAILACAM